MDGKEGVTGVPADVIGGTAPKELPAEAGMHVFVPLEHVLKGSSIDDPDNPGSFLGGVNILKRDRIQSGFSLQFSPEADKATLEEFRSGSSYMDNAVGIFDPVTSVLLARQGYKVRVVLPQADLKQRRITDPTYEIQLTREIINGTTENGTPNRQNVPVGQEVEDNIKEAFFNLQLHQLYEDFFSREENPEAHTLSFKVKYKG